MNYNPLLAEVRANPYPYYAYLREHAPVYWVESMPCWAVSRYADVDYVIRNLQIFSSALFEQPPFVRTTEKITRSDGLAVRGPKTLPLRLAT